MPLSPECLLALQSGSTADEYAQELYKAHPMNHIYDFNTFHSLVISEPLTLKMAIDDVKRSKGGIFYDCLRDQERR